MKICVLGSVSEDLFFEVDDWPQAGVTTNATNFFKAFGGKGANQAVQGGKLGGQFLFAGQLGDDQCDMEKAGVDMFHVQKTDEAQTGQAIIFLHKDGDNQIVLNSGANYCYKEELPLPNNFQNAIESSVMVILQLEIPMHINIKAAKFAQEIGPVMVTLDCGGDDITLPHELLQNIDFISPNETELHMLVPDYDPLKEGVSRLRTEFLEKYPNLNVVLKLGENGSMFVNLHHKIYMPVVSKFNPKVLEEYKIIDTTGAGDSFMGAFFLKLTELMGDREFSLLDEDEVESFCKKSLLFGNACAFMAICKKGAMPSLPTLTEVKDFLQKFTSIPIYNPYLLQEEQGEEEGEDEEVNKNEDFELNDDEDFFMI